MGGTVGLVVGFLFGGFNLLRYGPGPNGFVRSLGQTMVSSAAMFGFFMSIGTVIRTEGMPSSTVSNMQWELAQRYQVLHRARRPPPPPQQQHQKDIIKM